MSHNWIYPANNYGPENGIDSADVETFKANPTSSISREKTQNTIDASNGVFPTVIEFKTFLLRRDDLPGVEELTNQIRLCYEYQINSPKESKTLKHMLNTIEQSELTCLRVSDYQTKGLEGVASKDKNNPFYVLTKGSGISNKEGTSGGSKGIGKYSAFVASSINTVFYSTLNDAGEVGYIGVSKLRSAPIEGSDGQLTQGIGYYCSDEKLSPILEQADIDKDFFRFTPGTDIYIIGFNLVDNWKELIIAEILQSFMVSIVRGQLEVAVDDIQINKNKLSDLVYMKGLESAKSKSDILEIRSQYEMLTDESTFNKRVSIDDLGYIQVYVKKYNTHNEAQASKRCVFIRYPYMRIKHVTLGLHLPYSAMCIIENNELNELLRQIENPQHTNWELNRLNDFPDEKKRLKRLLRIVNETVESTIKEEIKSNDSIKTDFEGAGSFFPSEIDEGSSRDKTEKSGQSITDIKRNNSATASFNSDGSGMMGNDFSVGDFGDDDSKIIDGSNTTNGDSKSNNNSGSQGGDKSVLVSTDVSTLKIRNVARNVVNGEYEMMILSDKDIDNFQLVIEICGEGSDRYPLSITNAELNGLKCVVENNKIINLKTRKNSVSKLKYKCDQTELFTCEVKIYENR